MIDRQRIWSRQTEIGVLAANMICSCRLDPETEKCCSEGLSWDNRESATRLRDNGIMSKGNFLSLVAILWLYRRMSLLLYISILRHLGVVNRDSATYSQ